MELQTERLEIRPFTENDRAALAALLSNRQIGETDDNLQHQIMRR